ncbi:MAG TPA: hypothetical protein VI756_02805 [Blastocatellia bacterium]
MELSAKVKLMSSFAAAYFQLASTSNQQPPLEVKSLGPSQGTTPENLLALGAMSYQIENKASN